MKEISDEVINQMSAEAREHLETFKVRFQEVASRAMSDLICGYIPFIETDAWTNYRQHLQDQMEHEYMNASSVIRSAEQMWAKNIRSRIYAENKEELQNGVIKDLEAQIASLKEQINQRRCY